SVLQLCKAAALPRPSIARALRGDVVPGLIEAVADTDALPWPAFGGGKAHRVAVPSHQHGDGEIAALSGADDADELLLGRGEDHGRGPGCWFSGLTRGKRPGR